MPRTTIRPRAIATLTNGIARAWAVGALASLLLPVTARRGLWLPIHLFTAGAVSTAIVGNAQVIGRGLAAAPDPPRALIATQLGLLGGGTILLAVGVPRASVTLAAVGGAVFVAGVIAFAAGLALLWHRRRNRRHGAAFALYGASAVAMIAGGIIGALLAAGSISDGATALALRRVHVTVNLLGWASLPIVATLATMLPAAVRARAPSTPGWLAPALLAGVALLGIGLALGSAPVTVAGGVAWIVGCAAVVARAVRAFGGRISARRPRFSLHRGRLPSGVLVADPDHFGRSTTSRTDPRSGEGRSMRPVGPILHLAAGMVWLVGVSPAYVIAATRSGGAFEAFGPVALVGLLGGWIGQTLAGAWLLLLPTHRRADALQRRAMTAALDRGAIVTVIGLNGGLFVLLGGALGWFPPLALRAGAATAGLAAGLLLLRTFAYPAIARGAVPWPP